MTDPWVNPATGQMVLDYQPTVDPEVVTGRSVQERFEEFHHLNPEVLTRLEEMTAKLIDAGARRVGMKMLFEVLRHDRMLETRGDSFKLNNDYTSRYTRLIAQRHPDWEPYFSKRGLKSA